MATLPALSYETLHWTPSHGGSYSRSSRRGGPYRAAIPPTIADLQVALPSDVYTAAED
ncbi:MAG: hypothetical protein K0R62_8720, partial [Nonomuraea muscovyensis]|nr:hypothetical protein [Nonomuraea muscovyensis]